MSFVRAAFVFMIVSVLAWTASADFTDLWSGDESETETEATYVTEGSHGCTAPPDGDWISRHNFPSAPGNDTLAQQIRTIISLRRVLHNVYQGFAGGVNSKPEVEGVVPAPLDFNIVAIWDSERCTLSGVIYNFEQLVTDPLELFYDGRTLTGPYLNVLDTVPIFTRTGILNLTLFYPY